MFIKTASSLLKRTSLISMILFFLVFFLIMYVIAGFISKGTTVYESMFEDKDNIFMDYFNSVYFSLDDPYTKHSVIYPPFIVVIYGLIGNFIAINGSINPVDLRASYLGMFTYTISIMIAILAIYYIFSKYSKKDQKLIPLVIISIMFSYPVLFAIMRGNCILYAVIFVLLFLFGYRSKNKYVRYMSYVCLAVSSGIKIYAILFGILILKERNIKDILVCIVICILVLFIPFLFTDGDLIIFLKNAFGFSMGPAYSTQIVNINDIFALLTKIGLNDTVSKVLSVSIIIASYLLTLIIVVTNKNLKQWECVAIISTNIIFGFGPSVAYLFVFMIPTLLMFLYEESAMNKRNVCVAILLAVIFAVFPGITAFGSTSYFVSIKGLSVMATYCILVFSTIKKYGLFNKDKEPLTYENNSPNNI